jgi:hypothetical protein
MTPKSITRILSLPSDIIEDIASVLLPESVMSLALTCKSLYHLFAARGLLSLKHGDSKRNLLLMLEDELPEMLLCHRCVKVFKMEDITHDEVVRPWLS